MYNFVLLAALAASADAWGYECGADEPARGGVVIFFWNGPAALSEAEEQEWKDYVALLDEADRATVTELWGLADRAGKQQLLAQVRKMRPAKDEPAKNDKAKNGK